MALRVGGAEYGASMEWLAGTVGAVATVTAAVVVYALDRQRRRRQEQRAKRAEKRAEEAGRRARRKEKRERERFEREKAEEEANRFVSHLSLKPGRRV